MHHLPVKGAGFPDDDKIRVDVGNYPACGALCAGIEKISGRKPFYVGKPSPWIIRSAPQAG
jgi:ribonucleotide monophosphatase NagD (HAD superfamily)